MQRWLGENYQRGPNKNSIFWKWLGENYQSSTGKQGGWARVRSCRGERVREGARGGPGGAVAAVMQGARAQIPLAVGRGSRRCDSGGCKESWHNFFFSVTEEVFFPVDALSLLLAVLFPVLSRARTRSALLQIFPALAFYWPLWPRRCGRGSTSCLITIRHTRNYVFQHRKYWRDKSCMID